MLGRRQFLQLGSLGISALSLKSCVPDGDSRRPIVLSTWPEGIEANKVAWEILRFGGRALDAVEKGVMVTESKVNCCVGLGANPDREGFVTLDASIMDEYANCGSVAFLERIKHPISVARRVMEKTPHVFLVGTGALQFAIEEGFALESPTLSDSAKKAYEKWLKKSEYKPVTNIEDPSNKKNIRDKQFGGNGNHDTIGMIAMDANGNLSGSCTTSGMGFKMHGRVGDAPIIGAGLFVDNEVGAATATGDGEEVMRICGAHLVVEFMRQGDHPQTACKKAVDRIIKLKGLAAKGIQVGFIAINKKGEYGGYCILSDFSYAVCYANDKNFLVNSKHHHFWMDKFF